MNYLTIDMSSVSAQDLLMKQAMEDEKKMKKNIFVIGIISLLVGIAVLPMCSAITPYSVLSTSENCSDQTPVAPTLLYKGSS